MFLQINEIKIHDEDGRIEMKLEYDESFRDEVAKRYNKGAVTKKEIYNFILEQLESILEKDTTLIAQLNDAKTDDE